MSTTRDSTPCPSPRPNDYRDRKGKGRAIPSPSFPSHETERSEIIKLLESRLNESHQLLAKLKRLSRQQQPQAPRNTKKFKNIFFSPALGNQPKIWASSSSSSHKRHCKLNNSKMVCFQTRSFVFHTRKSSLISVTPASTTDNNSNIFKSGRAKGQGREA